MKSIVKPLALLTFLATGVTSPAAAQEPIAGSGQLPGVDLMAQPSQAVVDAIETIMANREERRPFLMVRSCFVNAGIQAALVQVCRQRLDTYYRELMLDEREALSHLPPIEIYGRLMNLAKDPDSAGFMSDMAALRGIVNTMEEAREFIDIKTCYRNAGPQPAFRQLCRQHLERFYAELKRTLGTAVRDVRPEVIHRRLLQLADADSVGDVSSFESLRNIRKTQQEDVLRARQEIATAAQHYCRAPSSASAPPLESMMAERGVCLCGYGRRYIAANPMQNGRPLLARYRQCGDAGRFRIRDLNGGMLMHGDWINLQASHGGFVTVSPAGAVLSDRPEAGKFEHFRIMRAGNAPGRVQPGEMVTLASPRGALVSTNLEGNGALRGTKEQLRPFDFFVLVPN